MMDDKREDKWEELAGKEEKRIRKNLEETCCVQREESRVGRIFHMITSNLICSEMLFCDKIH